jgi:hypothetical protein
VRLNDPNGPVSQVPCRALIVVPVGGTTCNLFDRDGRIDEILALRKVAANA